MISQQSRCPCGHRGGAAQHGGHDREVPGGDHAHAPATGQPVQLLIVLRGQSARADHHVNPGLDRGPDVVLDRDGAGEIDKDVYPADSSASDTVA